MKIVTTVIVLAGSLLIFLIVAVNFAFYSFQAADQLESKNVMSATPIIITAGDLGLAYYKNEIAADNKYKNKVVEVHGDVRRIANNYHGGISVQVRTEGTQYLLVPISCDFSEPFPSELAKLNIGQRIRIKGFCKGDIVGVQLDNCVIVKDNIR